jgi:hypothetical protein
MLLQSDLTKEVPIENMLKTNNCCDLSINYIPNDKNLKFQCNNVMNVLINELINHTYSQIKGQKI